MFCSRFSVVKKNNLAESVAFFVGVGGQWSGCSTALDSQFVGNQRQMPYAQLMLIPYNNTE